MKTEPNPEPIKTARERVEESGFGSVPRDLALTIADAHDDLARQLAEVTELLRRAQTQMADARMWEQRFNEQTELASRALSELSALRTELSAERGISDKLKSAWTVELAAVKTERDEARATLAQITPLKNSDIRLVIKLTSERDTLAARAAELEKALESAYHAMRHNGLKGYAEDARAALNPTNPTP